MALVQEHDLPPATAGKLERLLRALAAEADPHTTVADPGRAVDVHVADSLTALGLPGVVAARRVIDIGSGAGFPGLVLAVALPGSEVDLVEAARRKAAVSERLAAAAGIQNARVVAARAEDWARAEGSCAYDVATARALAPLAVILEYAAPLLAEGGRLIAWKGGRDGDEETAAARAAEELGFAPEQVEPVLPYEGSLRRHLHVYSKVAATPARYPRRPGMATKRPLG